MQTQRDTFIQAVPELILPGIWRFTFGLPEAITPVKTRHYAPSNEGLTALPDVVQCPVTVSGIATPRGYQVSIPLDAQELVYGLGLQLKSFQQRGLKKTLRVNADSTMDGGDSHAPVPFYVTTRGYGVLIDTARYATFHCGSTVRCSNAPHSASLAASGAELGTNVLPSAYTRAAEGESEVLVEIPRASGIDVYIFAGPSLREAVQRYNLFSGGGALPPRWGLGFWYRCKTEFSQDDVLNMGHQLREREIPCDVLGLEPGWQTQAYSCSFAWNENFPNPQSLINKLKGDSFRVNLWEHAFTHPSSPIYKSLLPHAGDYEVWNGITPDFLKTEARKIFGEFHAREHVDLGVSGYKLDECDNSDFTGSWSFPELSHFPSGADGEQMHSLFGIRYQDAIQNIFEARSERTYGLVRNSHALAAPYPFVLYSDLYDHHDFIGAIAQSSFSGLLWTPEVRHAESDEDLIRRLQSVVFSPLAMANAWYLKNPPWKQTNTEANNAGEFASDWQTLETRCREIIGWRMQFLPYLHAAFARYHRDGLPPFRALVMDYPQDSAVWSINDQYIMGNDVLVAPLVAGESQRSIYLPKGEWFDFWTGEHFRGQQHIQRHFPLEQIPLFVKSGTLLPLAQTTQHTEDVDSYRVHVKVFGDGSRPATLFEESGELNPKLFEAQLRWDGAKVELYRTFPDAKQADVIAYSITDWSQVNG